MANVKITELTELAAVDLAENDVLPIVDVGSDATKKVTIVSLRSFASANDFATYTNITANLDIVQTNVAAGVTEATAIEARRAANVTLQDTATTAVETRRAANVTLQDTATAAVETRRAGNTFYTYNTHSVISTANIIPSTNNTLSLGAPDAVYKDVHVGPGTVFIGNVRLSDTDGALTITSADDTSSIIDTQTSNVTAALNLVQDNVASVTTSSAAVETRRAANVTLQDTATAAVETRRATNATSTSSNAAALALGIQNVDVTSQLTALEVQIYANVDIVQDNVASVTTSSAGVETRRAANIAGAVSTITTGNLTASKALVSDGSGKVAASSITTTTLGYLDATSSIQSQIDAKAPLASPTFSGLVTAGHDLVVTGNLTVNGSTTTINSENKVIQDRFIMLANAVTGSPSGDVGIFLNRGTSGNAAIYYDESAKSFTLSETRDPDTNVTIHPTGAANLVVGAFSASTISYNGVDLNTAITDNVASLTTADTALEARRTANIAGAVSTITTGNLTASKALVSDGSGKVAASSVTSTVLGYLDATSSVQTQLNTKISTTDANAIEARRAANVTLQDTATAAVESRRTANIAGAVSTITTDNLATSKALVSDGSGKVAASSVTSTVLGYLDATSSVQTQLDTKISTTAANANDFITYTQLTANINLVQDNVVTAGGGATAVETRRVANIAGAVSTITTGNLTASKALVSDGAGKVAASSVTSTVLGYLDATSSVQSQLNTKITTTDSNSGDAAIEAKRVANIAGAVSTITTDNLATSKALVSDGSGKVAASSVTSTVLGYLDATSSVQTQLNTKISTTDANAIEARRAANVTLQDTATAAVETRRAANVTLQDTATTAVETRRAANVTLQDTATTAVETRRTANIAGAVSTITTGNLATSKALVSDSSGKVAASSVTSTVLGYLDATSSVQTQLDTKISTTDSNSGDAAVEARRAANVTLQDTATAAVETRRAANIAGAISTVTTSNLGTAKALVSDGAGKIAVSSITTTTLGYLDATSSVQTQIDAKAPLASPTFSGLVTAGHDLVITGNLTVNGATTTINSENKVIQDRFIMLANAVTGTPSSDVGIFLNRGTSGNAAIYYDESAKSFTMSETRDPESNTVIAPTGAANLVVGAFSASTISYNGADLNTAITDNVSTLTTEATAIEARRTANIAGAVSTITTGNLTASKALVSDGSGKVAASSVTSTVLGYLDATSSVQTQLNTKISTTDSNSGDAAVEARRAANIAGAVSTITTGNLTVDRVMISTAGGKAGISSVTTTSLGYLDATSSIQTQLNSKQVTITGAATTIDTENLTASKALVSDGSGKVAVSAVTATEIGYLDGVTSDIQTQIGAAETRRTANIAGAVSTITTGNLATSRAIVSDGSGKVAVSDVTATEVGYLDGVSSAIQTQLNAKQASLAGATLDLGTL